MNRFVEVERVIPFPVEQVFSVWLNAESFAEWFLPDPEVRLGRVELEPRVGGSFLIEMVVGEVILPHTGTYISIVPDRAISFSWRSARTADRDSLVDVTFEPRGDGTLLRLRHSSLPDEASRDDHAAGWTNIVAGLDTYLSQE